MDNFVELDRITHSYIEDMLAILLGTLMVSFGIIMLKQAGALTGSTAGIAFLISYVSPLSFGSIFFLVNLPFYWLSVYRIGWEFTLKTFCSVGLVSLFTHAHSLFIHFSTLNPIYATLFGNVIMGMGFILLFRHKASLGGINILALWLQDHMGLRAGKLQMVVDTCVVLASLFVVSVPMLIVSVVGAVLLNLIITMYHRPGRYII
ncbi:YitT family protein [Pantoea sp. Nvir]|uniref:YitT family protein n=1 Tax=Pantoea sp. Nvir TaxID=2576760 RepID=UPI001359C0AF|nr:YitT family protein [Pantoea sp. Nvir]MXP66474.1 YitT family protein [Pantoea sp. Nvir]